MNKLCRLFGHNWGLRTFGERDSWVEGCLRPEQQMDWKCWRCHIKATDHQRRQEKPLLFKSSSFFYWITRNYSYYSFKIKKALGYTS